jgi:ATP-binding protein involved in chromosome partitioning
MFTPRRKRTMSTTTSREGHHGAPGATPHPSADQDELPGIRHLIAVGSGKGELKAVSMGLLSGDDNPASLRGPMAGKDLHMFVAGVDWGDLDYLILDLPPGTGDTQLTLAHSRHALERVDPGVVEDV